MNGLKRTAAGVVAATGKKGRRAIIVLAMSPVLVGAFGVAPASAVTATPGHAAAISCTNWGNVDISGYMFGFSNRIGESVAWYPQLQRYQNGSWITVTSPSTDRWYTGLANRSFAPQADGWSSILIQVAPHYYYRLKSYYYWYANGYQTPAEYSSYCLAVGVSITF